VSFLERDIRRGMDVFSLDGVYVGTVVHVSYERDRGGHHAPHGGKAEATVRSGERRVSAEGQFSGESIGPMPTAVLGNDGPREQSPGTAYASAPRSSGRERRRPVALVMVRLLTALNRATLRPRVRRISVDRVQGISLERIILSLTAAELGDTPPAASAAEERM
jgi:hypothetical protein